MCMLSLDSMIAETQCHMMTPYTSSCSIVQFSYSYSASLTRRPARPTTHGPSRVDIGLRGELEDWRPPPLSIRKDSRPVKLPPALLESFKSFIPSRPSALLFDHIRLNIQHTADDLPSKQIPSGPSIRVFHDVA